MCEGLSHQIINTSAVNQAVFCCCYKFSKIIIEKRTLVLAVASKAEAHLFLINLRETWQNVLMLLYVSMSFSTFIFSTGIKLFIWHPVLLFGMLILSEQLDGFVQLPP